MKKIKVNLSGDGRNYGLKTGMKAGQYFCKLMENQVSARLDDATLALMLHKEFPHGSKDYLRNIRLYRSEYNRGKIGCQMRIMPTVIAVKYDSKGKPMLNLPGPKSERVEE